MPDTEEPVSTGASANEHRVPRFAELDAQLADEKKARQQGPAPKTPRRRRSGPRLPAVVRKEITRCARELRQHRQLLMADPKLKDRVVRFLRSLLPPHRKRGRPGLPSVSKAILLVKRFRHQYPLERPDQIWKRVYPEAIPGYDSMDQDRQKAERLLLRERVRSRGKQARRTV